MCVDLIQPVKSQREKKTDSHSDKRELPFQLEHVFFLPWFQTETLTFLGLKPANL